MEKNRIGMMTLNYRENLGKCLEKIEDEPYAKFTETWSTRNNSKGQQQKIQGTVDEVRYTWMSAELASGDIHLGKLYPSRALDVGAYARQRLSIQYSPPVELKLYDFDALKA